MRRRLTVLVAATTSLVLVAFLVPLALLVRTLAADRATSAAVTQAQSLATVVATADRAAVDAAAAQLAGETGHPVTVFLPDGQVLGTPAARSDGVELAALGQSATVDTGGGREVLVAVEGLAGGPAVVRTFVPDADLYDGVVRAWVVLGLLGLLLMAVGLALADRMARALVRPVRDMAAVSNRLGAGDLDARVTPAGPREMRDVAGALNHLAARIAELLAQERERVADLSHRLRTPLTALRLESERLRDPEEASGVQAGVDAVERAVSRAIADARRPAASASTRSTDAAGVVKDRVGFWVVLAEDQDRATDVTIDSGPLPVAMSREDLAACVDALLGNVFAHTPEGTGFAVRLTGRDDGGADLEVTDAGPGFPPGDAVRRGASGGGSTGLGLDIVRRAAQQSGGSLDAGPAPGGGARVVVHLGGPLPGTGTA